MILRETKADKQKAISLEEQARKAEERANIIKVLDFKEEKKFWLKKW